MELKQSLNWTLTSLCFMKKLFRVRNAALIINIFLIINTLALITLGIFRTFHAVVALAHLERLGQSDYRPGIELAEAIDIFLLSLVFLVFTVGINILFVRHFDQEFISTIPQWMRVRNFSELKFLLMEAIIATSFVIFITAFVKQIESLDWKFLIIPLSILFLAVSLKILKWKEKE